jgi:hypothetical protein
MSDKLFSLGKAIRETVETGALTGVERTVHFELEREAESSLNDFKWMRGQNARDIGLNVPVELFLRQLTVPGFPIGIETFGVSNLLTWSACARAGAGFLTGLRGNATLCRSANFPFRNGHPSYIERSGVCRVQRFAKTDLGHANR